ncbi:hypothetical protein Neosp_012514 [[Neocosmospora] mangrovei]
MNGGISLAGNFRDCTIGGTPGVTTRDKIAQCRNALFVSDPEIDKATLISSKGQRTPGTCEWVRKNSHYKTWLAGESRLLWISGGPGRGKTVLSLFLNEEVEKLCEATKDRLLFYFCRFQDERHNNPINVLRSLIYQILEFSIDGPEVQQALEYFGAPEKVQFALSSFECLWAVLKKLFSQPGLPKIFCIIDGVDECQPSHQLVTKLYDYCKLRAQSNDGAGLRLALIGRDIDGLDAFPGIKVDPDNEGNVNEDVKAFISSSLEPLARIQGFGDVRSWVEKSLLERAEGIFLWVSFVIDELSRKKTCLEILDTIPALPKGLHPIFARMLHQIESDQRQTSSLIFKWVALAKEPLTFDELAAAIGVQPGHPNMSSERTIQDMVAICQPFLKEDYNHNQVLFVHQSAKEYLLRNEHDTDQVLEGFRITAGQGHAALAHKCLLVLEDCALQHTDLKFNKLIGKKEYRLLYYAILHWPNHARLASRDATYLFNPDRPFFKQPSTVQSKWMKAYSELKQNHRRIVPQKSLHMASYLSIFPWVEIALQWDRSTPRGVRLWRSRKPMQSTDDGLTPLGWAVESGDENMAQYLLDSGADVDATNGWGETALFQAVIRRDEPIVRLLLDRGAKVNIFGTRRSSPLTLATRGGNDAIIRLLLDRGANANATATGGEPAVVYAARNADMTLLKLLLDHGANANATAVDGEPAVVYAARNADMTLLKLLLDHGANANATATDSEPPVLIAARHRHISFPRLILERVAKIYTFRAFNTTTPLIEAAYRGDDEMVRLILDSGANLNPRKGQGVEALATAISMGHESTTRLLINRGVPVKGQYAPLNFAASSGYEGMVQLLLEHGADVNLGGDEIDTNQFIKMTPLVCAARYGRDGVVKLLLERGADANAKASVSFRLCWSGSISLKRAIWQYYRVEEVGSAVVYAARWGHTTTVKLLLDHGVDISIKDADAGGRTALDWAVRKRFREIEELLLEYNGVSV